MFVLLEVGAPGADVNWPVLAFLGVVVAVLLYFAVLEVRRALRARRDADDEPSADDQAPS